MNSCAALNYSGIEESNTSPSQPESLKPAPVAGFRILKRMRDKKGTKHVDWKPAKIYRGKKWFVYFSYRLPDYSFKRFKVYEGLNSVKNLLERELLAKDIQRAIDEELGKGWNPLHRDIIFKVWTINQGLGFFKQRLSERGLRHRTIQTYNSVLKMLYRVFGSNDPLTELTKAECSTKLLGEKNYKKWSNATFNNNLMYARAIWNYLIDNEITEKNPFERIKPLPETVTRNQPIDSKSWEKIKEKSPKDLLKFLIFLYHTGTRPNEARQLKYEHILYDRGMILIPGQISKNKKDGYIPVSKDYLQTLKGEGFIFGTSVNLFSNKFLKLKRELNLPNGINLYSIKATRAVHLAQDGASPFAIMQLLRHHSISVTMTYLRSLGLDVSTEVVEKGRVI